MFSTKSVRYLDNILTNEGVHSLNMIRNLKIGSFFDLLTYRLNSVNSLLSVFFSWESVNITVVYSIII